MKSMKLAVAIVFAIIMLLADGQPSRADQVFVGIGFAIPPYVIKADDAGIEVDTIREAFKAVGYDVQFVYLPNLRLPVAFGSGTVDAVATNASYDLAADSGAPAYYSDVTVVFRNYAVSLKKSSFSINSTGDLADKSVLGFNNAVKYLGKEYAAMAESNSKYSELADQALQVRMLFSGRVDVVISDKRIFHYWRKMLSRSSVADAVALDQKVEFHPIFPSAPRHVGFRNEKLRELFNEGLNSLRQSGTLASIETRYAGIEIN